MIRKIFNNYIGKYITKYESAKKDALERLGMNDLLTYFNDITKYIKMENYSYPLPHDLDTCFKDNYEPLPIHKYYNIARYRKNLYAYTSNHPLKFKINTIGGLLIMQVTIHNIQYCFDVIAKGFVACQNMSWAERLSLVEEIPFQTINITPITENAFQRPINGIVYVCTSGIGYGTKFKICNRPGQKRKQMAIFDNSLKKMKTESIDSDDE